MSTKPKDSHEAAVKAAKLLAEQLAKNALSYLEKLDRYDCQELLAFASSNWLLSNEDFRMPFEPPNGVVSTVSFNSNSCVILFPVNPDVPPIDYRELHNLVRELTHGIYVMNQVPFIALDGNFDESTCCQIPPAYLDTRIGQIMVAVDYFVKCLWHGAIIPKEKRIKFSERWRTSVDVNQSGKPETKLCLLNEFVNGGLSDITEDPELSDAYSNMPVEQTADPKVLEERRFFTSYADHLCMEMHFFQRHVPFHHNLFVADSHYRVSSCIRLLEENLDHAGYERLYARLQHHEAMIEENLMKKPDVVYQLELLKVVSYLTPFLIAMKKRMKIPDTSRLLPNLVGDECRTERELPPLIVGPDFKCKNFLCGKNYFSLHGGIRIDLATEPMSPANPEVIKKYPQICKESFKHLATLLAKGIPSYDACNMLTHEINKKKYYAMVIEFETYYGSIPQKPMWVRAFVDEMIKMKAKRLPMTDIHIQEQFKKYFGYKNSVKYKMPALGLKAATKRGMVAAIQALCRKGGSRTGKADETGLFMMHYAAMYNRPNITAFLLINDAKVDQRRTQVLPSGMEVDDPLGVTPLHVAARCGSLEVAQCLVAVGANLIVQDNDGWAPIHMAAFFNNEPVIKMLVWKSQSQLELHTNNKLLSTPLLLAATSGGLSAVKCLINLGAHILAKDSQGNNMVHLAALSVHINVLKFFIKWNHPKVPVWNILVGMMADEELERKEKAVRSLDILTRDHSNWEAVLTAGAMPALIKLLKEDSELLQSLVTSVLCNISENANIREAITKAKGGPVFIQLLGSQVEEIQSRCAIILGDLAHVEGNKEALEASGVMAPLANLLDSDLEDVLVNTTCALRTLCTDNPENQTAAAECGVFRPLVEFLTVASDDLQASTAAALCALCSKHKENQDAIMAQGAARPLVERIRNSRSVTVQMKATAALEALVLHNPASQRIFIDLGAPKALLRLLKNIYTQVREQGANALWALAGNKKTQQKYIAEQASIPHIIQLLLEPTEKLLRVGCMLATALGLEDKENQIKLAKADAIQQLVRLLRMNKKESVQLMVIEVLGILCVGVAYRNNKETQRCIADEGGIMELSDLLQEPPSEQVQVAVAVCLARVVLSNRQNQERLQEEPHFHFDVLLRLLTSYHEDIRLQAGMALSIFAYNNTPQQLSLRELGGIKFSIFEPFFTSGDEFQQCQSAFQVVVLALVIVDRDHVELTARGINQLVNKLRSADDRVLVMACSFLSSLCRVRDGIADAIVASGAIDLLVHHLHSPDDRVRNGASVMLGLLSFNKTAARLMLSICRNCPQHFDELIANQGLEPRISVRFVTDFENARQTGLPSQWCSKREDKPSMIPSSSLSLMHKS